MGALVILTYSEGRDLGAFDLLETLALTCT